MNTINKKILTIDEVVVHKIESIEKMRRDFVANVSHELRTPLTVIHGYIEELISRNDKDPYIEVYKQIFDQTKRMDDLVSNLLLLSKLENTEQLNVNIVNIPKMIENIIAETKNLFIHLNHQYTVNVDAELYLLGDESELKSVFANLIYNANKYTPKNGTIKIVWFEYQEQAIFEVKDNGIGISQKHIPRLTERFYRVDKARSRNSGGTGLGLAIVKHALMRHEGQLEIESKEHQGSCFRAIFSSKFIKV